MRLDLHGASRRHLLAGPIVALRANVPGINHALKNVNLRQAVARNRHAELGAKIGDDGGGSTDRQTRNDER